jgi:hypothetical protein
MTHRAFLLLLVLLAGAEAVSGSEWRILDNSDGIEVALREEPGRDLPTMRGRAVLEGDIDRLLAIIIDPDQATEWAEGASKVTMLEREPHRAIIHTYIDIAWPVWDRDLVTSGTVRTVEPGNEYVLSNAAVDGIVPEKEGVIRMKKAFTQFHLKKQGPDRVWVEYLVNVDPGGSLPKWLVRWTQKSVPAQTLKNLQRQLKKAQAAAAP